MRRASIDIDPECPPPARAPGPPARHADTVSSDAAPDRSEPLHDHAEQLALVQEAIGIITWVWDVAAGPARWYGDLSPLLGLPPGGFAGSFPDFLACMHPDDAGASRERLIACLKGRLPNYRAEERICRPDGSVRWLETYGRGTYGPDGRALRLAGVVKDITDRKQAEAVLLASEQRFREFIEQAPVAIGMSRGETVLYGNPRFFELFRVPDAAALQGREVSALVAPASRAELESRSLRRERGEAVENSYEIQALRWDGSEFACLVAITEVLLGDGPATLVFVQDVSERAVAQAAVQQERDRANQYLRMAESILVAMDEQARVTLLNRKGHQVLGYEEGELIGQDWFSVCLPPEESEAVRGVYRAIMEGRLKPFEYYENHLVTKTGERRRIAWRNSQIVDETGRVRGTLSAGEDITERRRAEQEILNLNAGLEQRVAERTRELEDSNAALAEARDVAQAAMRAKGDFLANMSHEIRTPMNAILGMADLALRSDGLAPRVRDYLGHIRHAGDSLLVILNDILDFSKIESGKLEIESREFVLDDVLAKVTAMIGYGATEKGLDLLMGTAPDVPARLLGDPLRLGQVLLNLCSNAVKFTAQGEIAVGAATAGPASPGRVRLRFSVRDTGIGIDPEQLARLFRPFDQLDASTTREYGGTGLGLAICKQLVGLMGGEIDVHSRPGGGSDFRFTIDFGLPPQPPAAAPPAVPACRVLVVDDSASARELLGSLLDGLGVRYVAVASALAAVAALDAAAEPFDLVLLDWNMPVHDGLAAARMIAARAMHAPPRRLLMTAYGDEARAARAREEGLDGHLSQPLTRAALAAAIGTALAGGRPAPATAGAGSVVDPIEQLGGCRILLVEDNELNRIVAADLLGGVAGAVVTLAHNGAEALARIGSQAFDLVLMDVQMPVMDGYEATRRLRADPAHAALPIVAMTAHAMERDRVLCREAGMNDFASKPFEPRELFAVLAKWLPMPRPAAAATPARVDRSEVAAQAPAVSFELGLHCCMGRPDLYLRIVRRFLETRHDDARLLQEALACGDRGSALRIAHSLVSTAGLVGAEPLAAAARQLYVAVTAGEPASLPARLAAFEHEHTRVLLALQAHLQGQAGA